MHGDRPASPLTGRYLVRNPRSAALLALADRVTELAVAPSPAQVPSRAPRRVLLSIGGHLGDAVIATSALSLLDDAIPGVEIGVLLGSWARPVVEGHPLVKRIHTVDHWYPSRSPRGRWAKVARYRETRRRAVAEIREAGYDAAVDLYPFFPNAAALLRAAGVPVRIGYTSGGLGSLYTHPVPWVDTDRHVAGQHAALLDVLAPGAAAGRPPRYGLPPVSPAAREELRARLAGTGVEAGAHLVVHMGAGSELKRWPAERWRRTLEALAAEGHAILLTGSGDAERALAREVAGVERCVDLVGELSWAGFVAAIAEAQLVLGVDSVAGHLAAASGTPCVVVMAGMSNPAHWRPLGPWSRVVTRAVPCAPCYRSRGCGSMACIREVEVEEVLDAVHALLGEAAPAHTGRGGRTG